MSIVTDKIADALYLSGCLKFGTFKIKSGTVSPYYIDLARVLAAPKQLDIIAEVAAEKIRQITASEPIDKLASIELKGALIAPSIAVKLDLPCVIVRKEEKSYGVTGRTAGADITQGNRVLFFDDVISEGLSKIEGIKPLVALGASVKHMLVVVNREHGGKENLESLGYQIHALAKITDIVTSLVEHGHISKENASNVLDYVKNFKTTPNTNILP
ncbi:MAG: orotate phosphoribosyltransferase [Nitrososphaerota archaeon]|jgi:uridine monophosphate synthetase|uniref:orotate phosphoribosyltransferase n=1 Tax=Candidatus Bathycorpusculum sp. TaxID=2994959 RepID=UPI00282B6C60|nr:orotate phosphoribosyltransferase [Candidatus Termitimicrobium sp.]MCL2432243.1 orotate phosphoribosyltransferase [Candidatus Termitimicrobium sp.]MDR0492062.1 orotate phosphoribosyltransferase [Nitrososphaerota archaeon]